LAIFNLTTDLGFDYNIESIAVQINQTLRNPHDEDYTTLTVAVGKDAIRFVMVFSNERAQTFQVNFVPGLDDETSEAFAMFSAELAREVGEIKTGNYPSRASISGASNLAGNIQIAFEV
jgi:hypothetical protein